MRKKGFLIIEIVLYAFFVLLLAKSGLYLINYLRVGKTNILISEIQQEKIFFSIDPVPKKKLSNGAFLFSTSDSKINICSKDENGFFSKDEAEIISNNIENTSYELKNNGKYIIIINPL